ncbi:hypothetical protein SLA2020_258910 [Shorea laevis]
MESKGSERKSGSVLSVKELAKQPMSAIPHRYLYLNQEPPLSGAVACHQLPVINVNKLFSTRSADSELQNLHSACKEWGFFQLVKHGVSSSVMKKLKHEIEEFFNLPLEEKMKFKVRSGEFEGFGTVDRPDDKLDWGDRLFFTINPIHKRKPHLFPALPSSLRNALESYYSEIHNLGMRILGLMAKALRMDANEMSQVFEDGQQLVRINYYPPCPQPELVVGLRPHSDGGGLTILNQVNGVDGLQIKKDGLWIPVNFLPDALVVNVGDILEIMSNGVYKSVEHRATINSREERISLALFINSKLEAEVGPARSLINSKNPPLFMTVGMEDYLKSFFSRKLDGKTNIECMKITHN